MCKGGTVSTGYPVQLFETGKASQTVSESKKDVRGKGNKAGQEYDASYSGVCSLALFVAALYTRAPSTCTEYELRSTSMTNSTRPSCPERGPRTSWLVGL